MTTTAYISKATAKRELRVTGKTLKEIDALVAKLATRRCGARDKVFSADVNALIKEHSRRPEVKDAGIKGLSRRHKQVLRAGAETGRILETLRQRAAA